MDSRDIGIFLIIIGVMTLTVVSITSITKNGFKDETIERLEQELEECKNAND